MRVVFQPHRYSRTKAFAAQFAEELSQADELHLLPTYGAFETFDPSGEAESLTGYLPPRLRDSTMIFKHFYDLKNVLIGKSESITRSNYFLGAGSLTKWAHAYSTGKTRME